MSKNKLNGIPAFAGMTACIENGASSKNRHSREGGNPIFSLVVTFSVS
ncbi:MAG: hypothetical protein P4M15_05945 [Alphaproteobacteria bacterium]|nr:hypothetical protein [Alphaproteobacteria bacterium]